MSVLFRCPGCNQKLKVADRKIGLSIRCPACGNEAVVPQPKSQSKPKPVDPPPVEEELPPKKSKPAPPEIKEPSIEKKEILPSEIVSDEPFPDDELSQPETTPAEPEITEPAPEEKEELPNEIASDETFPDDELAPSESASSNWFDDVDDDDNFPDEEETFTEGSEEPEEKVEEHSQSDSDSSNWFEDKDDDFSGEEEKLSEESDKQEEQDDEFSQPESAPRDWFEEEGFAREEDDSGSAPPLAPIYLLDEEDDGEGDAGFVVSRRAAEDEEMDLTPMVDVTFLLLIFFMITASFSMQKTIQIPAPDNNEKGVTQSVADPEEILEQSIQVEITADNTFLIDDSDEPITSRDDLENKLVELMTGAEGKNELVLSADDKSFHEMTIQVIDIANKIGIQKIRLATYTDSGD